MIRNLNKLGNFKKLFILRKYLYLLYIQAQFTEMRLETGSLQLAKHMENIF